MTLDEAADWLRVHRRTVERMCHRGELDAFKTSQHGHWRVRVDLTGAPVILRRATG